ncbi:MAG: Ig-like domain-containing protein [Alistipes sp.]|nr:Ig-like domain-containing protein [Alistipes sp.]
MKKLLLLVLCCLSSLTIVAQNYSLKINESKYLSLPDPPYNGYTTHATWNCDRPEITFTESDEVGAIIYINSYFEGTATISCLYSFTYYGADDNLHPGHDYAYYYISCKGTTATISDTNIELNPGDTYRLSYTLASSSCGKPAAEWSSSDEYVAKVDQNGKVTAVSSGTALITCNPIVAPKVFCNVRVLSIPPAGISMSANLISVVEGKSKNLSVVFTPQGASSKITWTSSDTSIATVSSAGKVTGVSPGSTTVMATTANGLSATCQVNVISAPTAVNLPSSEDIMLGYGKRLIPELTPENSETTYQWSSSDTSVATVSADGMVTGKSVGTADITVKTDNGKSAVCRVTVNEAPKNLYRRNLDSKIVRIISLISRTKSQY